LTYCLLGDVLDPLSLHQVRTVGRATVALQRNSSAHSEFGSRTIGTAAVKGYSLCPLIRNGSLGQLMLDPFPGSRSRDINDTIGQHAHVE